MILKVFCILVIKYKDVDCCKNQSEFSGGFRCFVLKHSLQIVNAELGFYLFIIENMLNLFVPKNCLNYN